MNSQSSIFTVKSIMALTTFITAFSSNVIAVDNSSAIIGNVNYTLCRQNSIDTGYQIPQESNYVITPRKNFRERYHKISKAGWFRNAYDNMTLGDVITIEE